MIKDNLIDLIFDYTCFDVILSYKMRVERKRVCRFKSSFDEKTVNTSFEENTGSLENDNIDDDPHKILYCGGEILIYLGADDGKVILNIDVAAPLNNVRIMQLLQNDIHRIPHDELLEIFSEEIHSSAGKTNYLWFFSLVLDQWLSAEMLKGRVKYSIDIMDGKGSFEIVADLYVSVDADEHMTHFYVNLIRLMVLTAPKLQTSKGLTTFTSCLKQLKNAFAKDFKYLLTDEFLLPELRSFYKPVPDNQSIWSSLPKAIEAGTKTQIFCFLTTAQMNDNTYVVNMVTRTKIKPQSREIVVTKMENYAYSKYFNIAKITYNARYLRVSLECVPSKCFESIGLRGFLSLIAYLSDLNVCQPVPKEYWEEIKTNLRKYEFQYILTLIQQWLEKTPVEHKPSCILDITYDDKEIHLWVNFMLIERPIGHHKLMLSYTWELQRKILIASFLGLQERQKLPDIRKAIQLFVAHHRIMNEMDGHIAIEEYLNQSIKKALMGHNAESQSSSTVNNNRGYPQKFAGFLPNEYEESLRRLRGLRGVSGFASIALGANDIYRGNLDGFNDVAMGFLNVIRTVETLGRSWSQFQATRPDGFWRAAYEGVTHTADHL